MSRRSVSPSTDSAQRMSTANRPTQRSWFKTAVAFFPFLTLVISAWLYAFHLDKLANQSMVRSKELYPLKNTPKLDPLFPSEQDSVVIGDSKDNIFYFIQVTQSRCIAEQWFCVLSLDFATSSVFRYLLSSVFIFALGPGNKQTSFTMRVIHVHVILSERRGGELNTGTKATKRLNSADWL